MCLVTTDPTVHIAEEDMIVYKQGLKETENIFNSSFYTFSYKKDVLYETEIGIGTGLYFDCMSDRVYDNIEEKHLHYFGPGFHSAFNPNRFNDTGTEEDSIAEFIVPKGAEYIKDATSLLISNKIIFKQWI